MRIRQLNSFYFCLAHLTGNCVLFKTHSIRLLLIIQTTKYTHGCQIDTFCVKMTQFDVAWHNDTFRRNDDTIDEIDTFFNKKWHNRQKWHIFQ